MRSTGTVTVGGQPIAFDAVAGTLVVHAKDWDDTDALEADADKSTDKDKNEPKPEASMFYTAYFKQGAPAASRPITFLFNGGPGSSTVWLRMGAFGPVRVRHRRRRATRRRALFASSTTTRACSTRATSCSSTRPAPASAASPARTRRRPSTASTRTSTPSPSSSPSSCRKYGRWNSPKYVFGESYGTMRGAGLALALQNADVDLNGVILLSDILNWDFMPDDPQLNPGIDMPYIVALPTYAATAWYHQQGRRTGRRTCSAFLDRGRSSSRPAIMRPR